MTEDSSNDQGPMNRGHSPAISIIVPVYNGRELIKTFFDSFLRHQSQDGFELIVVDNGSSDGTLEELQKIREKLPFLRVFSFSEIRSSYAARNHGALQAHAKILAFTDFDCIVTEEYLAALGRLQRLELTRLVAGPVEVFYITGNVYEVFDKHAYLDQERYVANKRAATANLVVPAAVFRQLGNFDPVTSSGDVAFCGKAAARGIDLVFDSELRVLHPPRNSLRQHLEKSRRIGTGLAQLFWRDGPSLVQRLRFVMVQTVNLIWPRHQMRLFFQIRRTEPLGLADTLRLLSLCYLVGIAARRVMLSSAFGRSSWPE